MSDSFWAGGPFQLDKALREHYEPLLEQLRERCRTADDAERSELAAEIKRIEVEFATKLKSIDDAVF